MILGAIGFSAHHQLLRRRRWQVLWQSDQYKALWILLSAGILLLMFENRWSNEQSTWIDAVFQWVSALGTCGFETVDLQAWSIGAKLLLTAAMIVGGASGSTVGGIKLTRAVILFQGISWRFHRLWLRPHQIMRYKIDNQVIFRQDVVQRIESAATLATLWLLCIAVGIFILLHVVPSEYNLDDILFETASALGSVGLSIGITQPDLSWIGKLVLIVLMWMGRLEIIPVLLLLFVPLGQLKATLNQHVRF
jgi:trk system potassium uptake protein TrkH